MTLFLVDSIPELPEEPRSATLFVKIPEKRRSIAVSISDEYSKASESPVSSINLLALHKVQNKKSRYFEYLKTYNLIKVLLICL